MKIAYTMAPGQGETDRLLFRLAETLAQRGVRVCGAVQINTERGETSPCDMDVQVLPGGTILRISQALGPGARGCRLDPAALETAVGLVATGLTDGADCLILNKFGKHEADGRGFRPVIAEALSLDIPVLVGLNDLNKQAFLDFCGGEVTLLPPEIEALTDWLDSSAETRTDIAS